MPVTKVTDLADPALDPYRHLKQTNQTRDKRWFIAEGQLVVERLLASKLTVHSVLVAEHRHARLPFTISEELHTIRVSKALADALVGFEFHAGVLACGVRPSEPSLETLLTDLPAKAVVVVCPALNDPDNMGTIMRLSTAFGVHALLLGPGCPDAFSRRVLRVSMGNAFHLRMGVFQDLPSLLSALASKFGFEVAATVLDSRAMTLANYNRAERVALVLGHETLGVDASLLPLCQTKLTIPMQPGTDSLNVAVAAGIFLHDLAFRPQR